MLTELWEKRGEGPGLLFPARQGKHKGQKQIRVSPVFQRTVDELKFNQGVENLRHRIVFHSLRHSFESWLVMGGESLATVRELMGHAEISTTMRYSHLAPDLKRGAADRLAATLKNASSEKTKLEIVK